MQDRISLEAGVLSNSGRRQTAAALMVAAAMQAFDATIANVALPQLQQSFGGGLEFGSWVVTSYLCASAVTATLTGWLRRRYGARSLITGSVALFVAASLLCSVAPSAAALIEFRVLQGAAAGIIQPLAQAILLDMYPRQAHGRMLAVWGATIMTGPIFGPVLGGYITDLASWRWIFVVNLPLGLAAILGLGHMPRASDVMERVPVDAIGIVLLTVGVGALQLALQRSIGQVWPYSAEVPAEAALAGVALAAIVIRGRRSRSTLFRLRVFCDVNFAAAIFYNFMVGALLFTTIVFLPALSEGPLGSDATQAGLALSPRGIATMAAMLAIARLIDRFDRRALLTVGLVITAAALALISQVPRDGGGVWLATASAIQGVGVGLLFTPLSSLAFSTLAAGLRTDAAGLYSLLRQLGCATGVAAMTALLHGKIHANLLIALPQAAAAATPLSSGFAAATFAAYTACFQIMAIIVALMIPGILLFRDGPPDVVRPSPA